MMNMENIAVDLFTQVCESRDATLVILNDISKSCKNLEMLGFKTDVFRLELFFKHDELNQLYPPFEL